jgi:hypothetical protein
MVGDLWQWQTVLNEAELAVYGTDRGYRRWSGNDQSLSCKRHIYKHTHIWSHLLRPAHSC